MGIMNQTGVIEGNDLYFGAEDLDFDAFTAGQWSNPDHSRIIMKNDMHID